MHANLIPKYSGHLLGKAGKTWLAGQPLPDEEKAIVGRLVVELERNSDQLAKLDMTIIREALEDPRVVRLMTIPGSDRLSPQRSWPMSDNGSGYLSRAFG